MKKIHGIAILLFCVILPITAGCSGTPGASQSSSAEKTNQSWTGSWTTKIRGGDADTPLELVEQGMAVVGAYGYGDGTINGVVQDNRLSGTWSEKNGQLSGQFEFVLSENGLSFTGWWAYPEDNFDDVRAGVPNWRGERI
jgi:hypothetical protein